ncbi:two pore domain potassium channel family protein [Aureimonas sp. AU22]|uniref:two pore domain potassium channel family protein n=1 Tax=Aureimonas sp. AU22 TaxID=1638162 RepID=UPI000B154F35
MDALEQAFGAVLMLLVLLDVFLTVLYARAGAGIFSQRLARMIWRLFRHLPMGAARPAALSFCGPTILVLLVLVWSTLLAFGAGLIVHPELGIGIRASTGETPTDFITAVYVGGSSLSIVGASDFAPHTAAMKVLFLFNSVIGTSVISLTLTYLMQVYSALRERNALGLKLHAMSAETGDAAELIVRLFPDGELSGGYDNLSGLAGAMAEIKEGHHFYPILFYFRFREPCYSVSRTAFLTLDTLSLIKSALADDTAGWVKRSATIQQLWSVSLMLVSTLDRTFLDQVSRQAGEPTDDMRELWWARYLGALPRLRQACVPLTANEKKGAEFYVELRCQWDPLIAILAPAMAYSMHEIDPAGSGQGEATHPRQG